MTRFVIGRAISAVILMLLLTAIVFVLQEISPGDPVKVSLGANASAEAVAAERERLGLNDPLIVRYTRFVGDAVHGDLGTSLRTRREVTDDLRDKFPATAELVGLAFIFATALAIVFAFTGAMRTPAGAAYRGVLLVGATAPPFLLGLGGIVLFYSQLGWLPASGRGPEGPGPTGFLVFDTLIHGDLAGAADAMQHLLLPALVLSIAPAIAIGRIWRSSIEEVLRADHVRTARSKGLTDSAVMVHHIVRNSLNPALSMAGLQLGFIFAGVVVVEQVFSWPGLGNYLAESIAASDFPAIAGVTLILGALYIVVNAVVDILQAVVDPRIEN
ncbi:MAG TPA: ABC transporter permease [Miltoncostaea sp.]|nr:ABC transporter permease [Miltoncostaea sp.]